MFVLFKTMAYLLARKSCEVRVLLSEDASVHCDDSDLRVGIWPWGAVEHVVFQK